MLLGLDNKVMRGFSPQLWCKCPHLTHPKAAGAHTCTRTAANKGRQERLSPYTPAGWVDACLYPPCLLLIDPHKKRKRALYKVGPLRRADKQNRSLPKLKCNYRM